MNKQNLIIKTLFLLVLLVISSKQAWAERPIDINEDTVDKRKEEYIDQSKRAAYLAPLKKEMLQYKDTKVLINQSKVEYQRQITAKNLALTELYNEREKILKTRSDLFLKYQSLQAQITQIKLSLEGLENLKTLLNLSSENLLDDESLVLLKEYFNKTESEKLDALTLLDRSIESEVDLDQKELLLALRKSLEKYGSEIAENSAKLSQDEQIAKASFKQLLAVNQNQQELFKSLLQSIHDLQNAHQTSLNEANSNAEKIRSVAKDDFDKIEKFDRKIADVQTIIGQLQTHVNVLRSQVKEIRNKMDILGKKMTKAPKGEKKTRIVWE